MKDDELSNESIYKTLDDNKKDKESSGQKQQQQKPYEQFEISSSRISVGINFNSSEIVPEDFKTDLSKENDVSRFAKHFDDFLLKTQNTSYELISTVDMSIKLLLGMIQPTNSSGKMKSRRLFDVYELQLHLGTFTINFDLHYMRDMLIIAEHMKELLVLADITEFRPFLKPITDKEVVELHKALGRDFTPAEQPFLKSLRKLIIRDYFRLYFYTILFQKYRSIKEIDIKRRLIWKFKKASTIYQLLMGKTQMQLAEEEQGFLKQEVEYLEKKKAIDLTDRIYNESLFNIEPGESAFDIYIKNFGRLNDFLLPYHVMIKVTLEIEVNLMSFAKSKNVYTSTEDFEDWKEKEADRALEAEVKNICIKLVKTNGSLKFDVGFNLDLVELKFKEPIDENSINIASQTIKKVFSEDGKVYPDTLEKILVPFRLTKVSLLVVCELMKDEKSKITGAVMMDTRVDLGKVEVSLSPDLPNKLIQLKKLADLEIEKIKDIRLYELNPRNQKKFMKVVGEVHNYAKHEFFIKCEYLQFTNPSNQTVQRLFGKFIPKYRKAAQQVVSLFPDPNGLEATVPPNHQANYLEWRKKRDFKLRQAQRVSSENGPRLLLQANADNR